MIRKKGNLTIETLILIILGVLVAVGVILLLAKFLGFNLDFIKNLPVFKKSG